MHGDPGLWQQLTDRLAAMAVASLRAQIEAGAQAVQLFDSWAGSLSPSEYTRFALPATRAVLAGIADLGVPTILFGVGTGELLGLMGAAGSDVVGVDWRVPLDEARRRIGPGRALQGNLDPALCLAPWPVVADATRAVLAGAADGTGTGHVFNLGHGVLPETDPGILAAVVELVHAETGPRMTTGVLLMAHGTPATHRPRSRPSTPASAAAGRRRPSSWPSWRAATTPSAASRRWPTAPRRRSTRCARRSRRGRRALRRVVRRQAHRPPHRGGRRHAGRGRARRASSASSSPPTARPWARRSTSTAPPPRSATTPFVPVAAVVRRAGAGRRSSPRASRTRSARVAGRATRSSSPRTRCPSASARPATPIPSSWPSRPAWWPRRPGSTEWLVAWQSAGRTPEPWLGPDVRDVVRQLAADGRTTRSWCAPSGSWPTTSRCSTTSTSSWRAVAAESGLAYARTASLNDDPVFIATLADLIVGGGRGALT